MTTPNAKARVSFASLTSNNLGTVRKLNSVLFPIKYSEKFYQDILLPEVENFCKLVYYNDIPVGTVCCRLETKEDRTSLYLMTMGILAPYRSKGLGSQSLELILKSASSHAKIDRVYLHVQVSNEGAKKFYEQHGFKLVGLQTNYYKKIVPHDAWILEHIPHATGS
ncbi:N-acetyltransferase NAT13 [Pleurotus eryngii]|uniref:N-acetyltransferase NAT13 n=1 Tax=Pleurotus eryngii TaxID=5323 RepID=A0A9P6AC90_PLEER|nr:N-acetyltransferase NAT13 [Pleurotus eryngii]